MSHQKIFSLEDENAAMLCFIEHEGNVDTYPMRHEETVDSYTIYLSILETPGYFRMTSGGN